MDKASRVWGLGSMIGDRQKTVVLDSDYADLEKMQAAIFSTFSILETPSRAGRTKKD